MEVEIIQRAGLSAPLAKTYLALVQNGALTPTKIAGVTGETRTNTYALLEKLEKLSLVKNIGAKKTTYEAAHPSNLELLAEKRRRLMAKNEAVVKDNISNLIDLFWANSEMPGSRTLSGMDGIKEVYLDIIRTRKDQILLRTIGDKGLDRNFLRNHQADRIKYNIHTYALTPDTPKARRHAKDGADVERLLHRIVYPAGAYDTPVAIHVYGDKVAFIAYGEAEMATIIDSPLITSAMRSLLNIMARWLESSYPQPESTFPW